MTERSKWTDVPRVIKAQDLFGGKPEDSADRLFDKAVRMESPPVHGVDDSGTEYTTTDPTRDLWKILRANMPRG